MSPDSSSPCPQCGASRQPDARFCGTCAFDFWKAAENTVAPATTDAPPLASAPPVSAEPLATAWHPASKPPRSRLRVALVVVGVILALGVVGSVAGQGDENEPPVAEATTTSSERVATPTPSPSASERVVTPPIAPNTGALGFQLFAAHVAESAPAIADGMTLVATDAGNLDVAALSNSSVDLWIALGNEASWMDENPPEACFATLHAKYSEGIDVLYEALDQISDGAIYSDVDLLTQGSSLMTEGSALITDATALIPSASAACGVA
jgi:hypothetical protein